MTREALAWWLTFGSGFASGAVITAIACGKVRRVSRAIDRLLEDDAASRPQRSIPLPRERTHHLN